MESIFKSTSSEQTGYSYIFSYIWLSVCMGMCVSPPYQTINNTDLKFRPNLKFFVRKKWPWGPIALKNCHVKFSRFFWCWVSIPFWGINTFRYPVSIPNLVSDNFLSNDTNFKNQYFLILNFDTTLRYRYPTWYFSIPSKYLKFLQAFSA